MADSRGAAADDERDAGLRQNAKTTSSLCGPRLRRICLGEITMTPSLLPEQNGASDFGRATIQLEGLLRNGAIELCVLGEIDLTHSALANLRADFVATQVCARGKAHQFTGSC